MTSVGLALRQRMIISGSEGSEEATVSYVSQVLEQAAALGGRVDAVLAPARELYARADRLNADLQRAREAADADVGALVVELAAGRLDLSTVPERQASATAWAWDSPASSRVVEAVAVCRRDADTAVVKLSPALYLELRSLVGGVVDESVQIAGKLPRTVVDAMSALRAGPETGAAWNRLSRLVGLWVQAHGLAKVLRLANWVPGPAHASDGMAYQAGLLLRDPVAFCQFLRPELLPSNWGKQPMELQLATAKAAGCEPGLYDWPDAVARLRRYRRRNGDMFVNDTPVEEQPPMTLQELAHQLPVIEATAQQNIPRPPASAKAVH